MALLILSLVALVAAPIIYRVADRASLALAALDGFVPPTGALERLGSKPEVPADRPDVVGFHAGRASAFTASSAAAMPPGPAPMIAILMPFLAPKPWPRMSRD